MAHFTDGVRIIFTVTKNRLNVQTNLNGIANDIYAKKKLTNVPYTGSFTMIVRRWIKRCTILYSKGKLILEKLTIILGLIFFFKELTHRRKFALRLGRLAEEQAHFNLRPEATKKLMNGSLKIEDLTEKHFLLDVKQKGVDMRIAIDISSLAFKKQVDRIILISGDSDFVPASKQARREGIDFILDPMRSPIKEDLFEHIDGMRTKASKLN